MIAIFGCLGFISVRRVKKYLSTLEIVGDRRIISGMTVRRWGRFVLLGIERVVGSEQLHVVLHFLSYTSFLNIRDELFSPIQIYTQKKKYTHARKTKRESTLFRKCKQVCDFYHFCPQKKKNVCDGDSTTRDSNFLGFTPANAPIPLALAYLDFFFF